MEISVLKKATYEGSTGIPDESTKVLFPLCVDGYTTQPDETVVVQEFKEGMIMSDTEGVYEKTTKPFEIVGVPAASGDIHLGDVYYVKDDVADKVCLSEVIALDGTDVALQPEVYVPVPPTTLAFGAWNHRYAHIGTLSNGAYSSSWSAVIGTITHLLFFDGSEWRYKLTKMMPFSEWEQEKQHSSSNYLDWVESGGVGTSYRGKYNGKTILTRTHPIPKPIPFTTIMTDDFDNSSPTYGERFKFGAEWTSDRGKLVYGIMKETIVQKAVVIYEEVITMLPNSLIHVPEEKAVCVDSNDCANAWAPKTIIRRGDELYIRTDTADDYQTFLTNKVLYEKIKRIGDANWGWTLIRPTQKYSPLDGKKYTYLDLPSPVEYTVSGESFDTLAINGLISDEVEITFTPAVGPALPMIIVRPDCSVDVRGRLPKAPTTIIKYAQNDITGTVHMKFINHSGNVQIGGIYLGQSMDAGFTNLVFTNKFKDYSPFEKDQFGNILYIKGVKTNVYSGTVDIKLTDYDRINRAMASIGGSEVILNGSDNVDNDEIDSKDFFAATQVVGRVRNFALRTKLDNKRMAQMASYNFEIEESI